MKADVKVMFTDDFGHTKHYHFNVPHAVFMEFDSTRSIRDVIEDRVTEVIQHYINEKNPYN